MIWGFPKIGEYFFGVLTMRILLFKVLYEGPLFSETPIWGGTRIVGESQFKLPYYGGV